MNDSHSQRPQRIALRAALLAGIGVIGASAAPTSAAAMPHLATAQPAAMRAGGPTVRLHQKVVRVTISNFAFHPAKLIVSPGTKIIWTNDDSDEHTVTSDKAIWSSAPLNAGTQFARTFKAGGSFPYHCSIHPFMHGAITIKK